MDVLTLVLAGLGAVCLLVALVVMADVLYQIYR